MNIMIVTDTYPPDINGVARTLQTFAHGLSERGHKVVVVTTTADHEDQGRKAGVKVIGMSAMPLPGYAGIRIGLVSRRQMEELITIHQTEAMYVAVESLMGLNAVRAAGRMGVSTVSGFHTNFHTYSQDYSLPILRQGAESYLRHVHNRTARTLTPSESTAQQLRDMGIRNVGVLGRGVDTKLFNPDRRDLALRKEWGVVSDDTPVAMFVGRIAAEKNLPLVVKSFQQIMQQKPDARCVFVGDGPMAAELKSSYPEFIHAGARTGTDLARYYASADLFIFPSLSETFGNVITEAMASGLVTVSFNYAATLQNVKHGVNGFAATYGEEDSFLRTVNEALEHSHHSAIRNAAVSTAAGLSWDAIIAQFEHELRTAAAPFIFLSAPLEPSA